MMFPILISVSVAPVSYYNCASAPLLDAASNANAATEAIATLFVVTGITVSLFPIIWMVRVMVFLIGGSLRSQYSEYHFTGTLTRKSPCGKGPGVASLVVRGWPVSRPRSSVGTKKRIRTRRCVVFVEQA